MPLFLEKKLKKEYPDNPSAVYGTMNKLGYMKGSKETAKGRDAERKHAMDSALKRKAEWSGAGKMKHEENEFKSNVRRDMKFK